MKNTAHKIILPHIDHFQKELEEYNQNILSQELNDHYQIQPYYKKHKIDFRLYQLLGIGGHIISAMVASSLVFFYCYGLFAEWPRIWGIAMASLLTIFLLGMVELFQYRRMEKFWKTYFQFGINGAHKKNMVFLGIKIILLVSISITTSYLGGQMLPANLKEKPKETIPEVHHPTLRDIESIKKDYDLQISEAKEAIENAEAEILKNGNRWEYRLAIIDNNKLIPELRTARSKALSQATQENGEEKKRVNLLNKEATENAERLNRKSNENFKTEIQGKGQLLAYISCAVILLVVYSSFRKEQYRFKSHLEFVAVEKALLSAKGKALISTKETTDKVNGKKITDKVKKPRTRKKPVSNSRKKLKQEKIIVAGFKKPMTISELKQKLKQYQWKLNNGQGRAETAERNIRKFQEAISELEETVG